MHLNLRGAAEIARATRHTYNEYADQFEQATRTLDQFPGLDLELDRFAAALPSGPVLDLGCGAGRDTEYLLGKGLAVISGDISERMLEKTRTRCAAAEIVQLNLLDLPFRDAVFAGVWACASVLHVPRDDHRRSFSELKRVLRPGGTAAISLQAGDYDGWKTGRRLPCERWFALRTSESVEADLLAVGFISTTTVYSSRGDWFVTEALKS
ncbi:class I SAM-dependent methyltransferase [Amycolatopsis sp. 195334CR]|uniref:class I SAM-dependent DNA methyltransferase n=1 Tax=Amycolatopsis sp. 195334CR TaxID=2814588 RepID=UPI001A903EAA|nr:class I SAM-dependent methyltransferase [Amycolatopsis sp. 195334CR]MBN6034960.1 methyltransferase domain-containing protein [Amycolatopsis sp. 195334CR]